LRQIIARHFDAAGQPDDDLVYKYNTDVNGRENNSSPPNIVDVMTSGPLPHHLAIHNTTATDGGQSFAGINLGTITYAPSEMKT